MIHLDIRRVRINNKLGWVIVELKTDNEGNENYSILLNSDGTPRFGLFLFPGEAKNYLTSQINEPHLFKIQQMLESQRLRLEKQISPEDQKTDPEWHAYTIALSQAYSARNAVSLIQHLRNQIQKWNLSKLDTEREYFKELSNWCEIIANEIDQVNIFVPFELDSN